MLLNGKSKLLAAAVAVSAGLLAAPGAAHADYWRHGGWGGPRYYPHYYHHRGFGIGPVIAGTVLGLGAAAAIGSVLAPPPPVVYAPPPPAYYAPPPAYYAPPPPAYYGGY